MILNTLPNIENINRAIISYSELINSEELLFHNFDVESKNEIASIMNLLGSFEINPKENAQTYMNFDLEHWLVQLYYNDNQEVIMIYVDKERIMGNKNTNSELYLHLSKKYS